MYIFNPKSSLQDKNFFRCCFQYWSIIDSVLDFRTFLILKSNPRKKSCRIKSKSIMFKNSLKSNIWKYYFKIQIIKYFSKSKSNPNQIQIYLDLLFLSKPVYESWALHLMNRSMMSNNFCLVFFLLVDKMSIVVLNLHSMFTLTKNFSVGIYVSVVSNMNSSSSNSVFG
jgi:hypothetical protein